ncbi:hypothetical protein GTX53_22300 [Streptomyces sp. SID5594]|uniref:hypothetical protein n=1 Tax=unclassified Streptomyces TaxID=2593676 RepID=UPI00036819B2|nr:MULTISPECIES: hypothetical protein [unclassified Streptomyces]MZF56542.1 hypothetical protein [Streptomyces sp. SID5594]
MSTPFPPPDGVLPDRSRLAELLEAERTLALQRILPAWAYFLASVAAAAGIWLSAEGVGRAVALAAVLIPGLHLLLRAKALTEAVIVFRDDDEEDDRGDGAEGGAGAGGAVRPDGAVVPDSTVKPEGGSRLGEDADEPEEDDATMGRIAGRAVAVTGAVVCVVLGLAVAFLPLAWLRIVLPALCLWFVYDLYRSHRKRVEGRRVIARAETEPWYPAYRRLIEERRASLG